MKTLRQIRDELIRCGKNFLSVTNDDGVVEEYDIIKLLNWSVDDYCEDFGHDGNIMHMAADCGNYEVVKALLKDTRVRHDEISNAGTPLFIAISKAKDPQDNYTKIALDLINTAETRITRNRPNTKETPFGKALENGNYKIAAALIRAGIAFHYSDILKEAKRGRGEIAGAMIAVSAKKQKNWPEVLNYLNLPEVQSVLAREDVTLLAAILPDKRLRKEIIENFNQREAAPLNESYGSKVDKLRELKKVLTNEFEAHWQENLSNPKRVNYFSPKLSDEDLDSLVDIDIDEVASIVSDIEKAIFKSRIIAHKSRIIETKVNSFIAELVIDKNKLADISHFYQSVIKEPDILIDSVSSLLLSFEVTSGEGKKDLDVVVEAMRRFFVDNILEEVSKEFYDAKDYEIEEKSPAKTSSKAKAEVLQNTNKKIR